MYLFLTRFKVPYFLVIFLLLLLGNFSIFAKQLPVEENVFWERNFVRVTPVDLNSDSIDELLIIVDDYNVQPENQNLQALIATRYFNKGTFDNNSMVGGLDSTNLWVSYVRQDSLFLYDLWPRREIFVTFGKDLALPKGWDGYPRQIDVYDINADGRLEVIVAVTSGFDLRPRGIFVLDWLTGKLLWKHLFGPVPCRILTQDIDGDGKTEILCGTAAVGNGNIENGTDDFHTYVFLLNSDGKIRWSKLIGLYSSFTELSILYDNQKNSYQIFVYEVGVPAGDRKSDSLFILDALTGQILISKQYGQFNRGHAIISNKYGRQLLVVGGTDDTLRAFDEKLNLMHKCAVQGNGCSVINYGNFIGRGQDEIAVQTTDDQLCLYDSNLNLLGKFPIGSFYELYPCKLKNKTRLLLMTERDSQPYWRLMEFNIIPVLSRPVTVRTVIYVGLILIFVFGITLVYTRYRQTRDIRTVIRRLTGNAGVIELNRKGEIVSSNPFAREILKKMNGNSDKLPTSGPLATISESAKTTAKEPNTASVQETVIAISPEQTYLVRCVPVKRGALMTFEDISTVEYLKRVTSWTPVAQKLAHGIKNPLSTILGAVEQVEVKCEDDGIKKYIGYVKDEVTKLKKMSDAFMRFTKTSPPMLEQKNINDVIKKIMTKYESILTSILSHQGRGETGEIRVEYDLDGNLPLVAIDEESITNVLDIVIKNAVEAMAKGGTLQVKTQQSKKMEQAKSNKYLLIEITDTGSGIPAKYVSKVFEPYFTYDKPLGTGLGLSLAKKIVEDHKGIIELQSKEGVGTQVNIYLPLS